VSGSLASTSRGGIGGSASPCSVSSTPLRTTFFESRAGEEKCHSCRAARSVCALTPPTRSEKLALSSMLTKASATRPACPLLAAAQWA
jgi:hypothetical protein